jgi:hypothetical protein
MRPIVTGPLAQAGASNASSRAREGLDLDLQRVVSDGEHPHPRQANKTFEHDRCRPAGTGVLIEAVPDTRFPAGLLCTSTHPTRS